MLERKAVQKLEALWAPPWGFLGAPAVGAGVEAPETALTCDPAVPLLGARPADLKAGSQRAVGAPSLQQPKRGAARGSRDRGGDTGAEPTHSESSSARHGPQRGDARSAALPLGLFRCKE